MRDIISDSLDDLIGDHVDFVENVARDNDVGTALGLFAEEGDGL